MQITAHIIDFKSIFMPVSAATPHFPTGYTAHICVPAAATLMPLSSRLLVFEVASRHADVALAVCGQPNPGTQGGRPVVFETSRGGS